MTKDQALQATARGSAMAEMLRVLTVKGLETQAPLGRSAMTVQRWRHGELHDATRPMADHVLISYLGVPRPIARGNGRRRVSGWTRQDSVTTIPAGRDARWDIDGDLDTLHAYFRPAVLHDLACEHGLRSGDMLERTASLDQRGTHLLRMLAPDPAMAEPDRLFAGQAADLLAMHMLTTHLGGGARRPTFHRGGLSPGVLRRLTDFMDASPGGDVTLDQLAGLAGLSTFHFCRAFKQSVGVAPYQWRRLRRIEKATELLRTTRRPIAEIAALVGYAGSAQLARLFKQEVGRTPRSIRQEMARRVG